MTQTVAIVALVIFAIIMMTVGVIAKKKVNSVSTFLLGGRKIGPWLSAFSYGTAYFSAVVFVGYAGMHGWNIGLASIWIGVGNAILGCYFAWKFLAKRTRRMTHNLSARTMPEFFFARYGSGSMKLYAATIVFIFLVPYAASVYKGLGTLFSSVFPGTSEVMCMLLVAILTAIYLILGGYFATSLNDFIQGIIMIFGVILMVMAFVSQPEVGGFIEIVSKLKAIDPKLVSPYGGENLRFLITNILLTSFGTWGLPQMVHKYYAINDESNIRKATVVSTGFALIIGCGAYFVGSLSHLFISPTAEGLPDVVGGYDNVVPSLLMKVFTGNLGLNILLSIILLLLLSASMSTLSAIVLTSSSAISVDILKTVKPDMKEKQQLVIMRILCFVFVALSFFFATMNISFIVNLMSFSWGIIAGSFIGPYFWGLYSKKITKVGAWSGLLSGLIVVGTAVIVTSIISGFPVAKSLAPEFGVSAMAVSFVITPIVSKFTKQLPNEFVRRAFMYIDKK